MSDADARRVTGVLQKLALRDFRGALTGGVAIQAHSLGKGCPPTQRPLHDLDFVIDSFGSIPKGVAEGFLLNHVHPFAPPGKILMQLIDPDLRVRVDLFRACGRTLARSRSVSGLTQWLDVVSVADLLTRATAHVYGNLVNGRDVEAKYVRNFLDLIPLHSEIAVSEPWLDHRGPVRVSFVEAMHVALKLLDRHPQRISSGSYSAAIAPCDRCLSVGPFRCVPPEAVVEILGYW